jgi:hypothetical protein
VGAFGTDYGFRAVVTLIGLGANLPADAIYPLAFVDGDDRPLDGANRYVVHFDNGATPPAAAFWSLTLSVQETSAARRRHESGGQLGARVSGWRHRRIEARILRLANVCSSGTRSLPVRDPRPSRSPIAARLRATVLRA